MEEINNICLYIDELKSDDNQLKINSLNKLLEISKFLSIKWVNLELMPYLLYIIEEIENEEDFLRLVP